MPNILLFGMVGVNPYDKGDERAAILAALDDLGRLELVRLVLNPLVYEVTPAGKKVARGGLPTLWSEIFRATEDLDEEQSSMLRKAVEIGQVVGDDFVLMREMTLTELQAELGPEWEGYYNSKALGVYHDLAQMGLTHRAGGRGGERLRPTYRGAVRATRKEKTELRALVENLLPDWETTNVDFKRELHLSRDKEKAEFVRDTTALANTKSPGRRFLVIGFGPSSRMFEVSVDPAIKQDRLEDILNAYADPAPRVIFSAVPWERGEVGLIEVVRKPWHLPHRIKRNIAHLRAGEVYVRHGSHTQTLSPGELASLEAEGQRAREHMA